MNDYFKTVIKERIADELERGYDMGELAALISEAMNEAEASYKEYQKQQVHAERIELIEDILTNFILLIQTYEDELPENIIQEMKSIKLTEEELEDSLRWIEKLFESYSKMSAGMTDIVAKLELLPKPVKVDFNLNKDKFDPDVILRKWVNGLT